MNESEPDFNRLKKLWTLKLVVDAGGLKQAATISKVSLSAVSQTITGLEKVLGKKLLIREGNHVVPTPFCSQLLYSVTPAFKTLQEISNNSLQSNTIKMSWLDFGITEIASSKILPPFLYEMKRKLPKMKLKLKVGRCYQLTSLVKKGSLCMALVSENEEMKGLSVYPIFEDRLALYSAKNTSPEKQNKIIKDLGFASISSEAKGHPLYYSRFLRAVGTNAKISLTCESYETLYSLICSGEIVGILPEKLATKFPGKLQEVHFSNASFNAGKFTISMISKCNCDPAEDQFLVEHLKMCKYF